MDIKQLEVNIIYITESSLPSTIYEIRKGMDILFPEYRKIENFWNLEGGIEVTVNGCFTIINTIEFHYLSDICYFLLCNLYLCKGMSFDPDKLFFDLPLDGVIILKVHDWAENYIKVDTNLDKNIKLSLTCNHPDKRTTRYLRTFDEVIINKELWLREVYNTLCDYFYVYEPIYKDLENPDEMYTRYLELWYLIKNEIESNQNILPN